MGHLLLGSEKNSDSGLMRAQWNKRDLQLATVDQHGFGGKQAAAVWEEVTRRKGQVQIAGVPLGESAG